MGPLLDRQLQLHQCSFKAKFRDGFSLCCWLGVAQGYSFILCVIKVFLFRYGAFSSVGAPGSLRLLHHDVHQFPTILPVPSFESFSNSCWQWQRTNFAALCGLTEDASAGYGCLEGVCVRGGEVLRTFMDGHFLWKWQIQIIKFSKKYANWGKVVPMCDWYRQWKKTVGVFAP